MDGFPCRRLIATCTCQLLVSKMTNEKWVPISVIAEFKKVKAMTDRMEDVVEALRRSTIVELDDTETMVRPKLENAPRTTLIIRELPEDTERQVRPFDQ